MKRNWRIDIRIWVVLIIAISLLTSACNRSEVATLNKSEDLLMSISALGPNPSKFINQEATVELEQLVEIDTIKEPSDSYLQAFQANSIDSNNSRNILAQESDIANDLRIKSFARNYSKVFLSTHTFQSPHFQSDSDSKNVWTTVWPTISFIYIITSLVVASVFLLVTYPTPQLGFFLGLLLAILILLLVYVYKH